MNIFPAIDLYDKKAVRLFKGDYAKMTVYSDSPELLAKEFEKAGARFIHIVDLEGAKCGEPRNIETIKKIISSANLFCEVGGGIRNIETAKMYFDAGVDRVIIGTAAVEDEEFLCKILSVYGDKVAVGIDVRDGSVAIKGWTEKSAYSLEDFMGKMNGMGVKTVICTDISKDGALCGTNIQMYESLSKKYSTDIIASGGVSSIEDIRALLRTGVSGAIIGKAYYTGAIDLKEAISLSGRQIK